MLSVSLAEIRQPILPHLEFAWEIALWSNRLQSKRTLIVISLCLVLSFKNYKRSLHVTPCCSQPWNLRFSRLQKFLLNIPVPVAVLIAEWPGAIVLGHAPLITEAVQVHWAQLDSGYLFYQASGQGYSRAGLRQCWSEEKNGIKSLLYSLFSFYCSLQTKVLIPLSMGILQYSKNTLF